jgi:hypothetical protein
VAIFTRAQVFQIVWGVPEMFVAFGYFLHFTEANGSIQVMGNDGVLLRE